MRRDILKRVLDVGISLSMEKDFKRLLEKVLVNIMQIINCDAGNLYLLQDDTLQLKITRNEKMIIIDDTCSTLEVLMKNRDGDQVGLLQLINTTGSNGESIGFSEELIPVVEALASEAAVAIQNARYVEDIRGLFQSFVEVMSSAVDERTPYNLTHTKHMAEYGGRFVDYVNKRCREAGQPEPFDAAHKEEILMSIWLHDIGKVVTPLEVMNKDTRLRPDQYMEICHRMEKAELWIEIMTLKGLITDEEKLEKLEEVNRIRDLVESVNHAGVIREELVEELKRARNLTYKDIDGKEHSWFTEEEYGALMIQKGTLSASEREIMESHVQVTDKLLSKIKFSSDLSRVREWAVGHHELLNGTGYPNRLSGDQIPYEVRMITILDIFDALVADDRPYKPGMSIEKAIEILTEMAEKEGKLDIRLTNLFIEGRCWEDNEKQTTV